MLIGATSGGVRSLGAKLALLAQEAVKRVMVYTNKEYSSERFQELSSKPSQDKIYWTVLEGLLFGESFSTLDLREKMRCAAKPSEKPEFT